MLSYQEFYEQGAIEIHFDYVSVLYIEIVGNKISLLNQGVL